MAKRAFSWYLAKPLRFVSSELGNVSEVASLSDRDKTGLGRALPFPQRSLAASTQAIPRCSLADVELADRTVERFALAVHRR